MPAVSVRPVAKGRNWIQGVLMMMRLRQVVLKRALRRIKAISSATPGAAASSSSPTVAVSFSFFVSQAASQMPSSTPGRQKLPTL